MTPKEKAQELFDKYEVQVKFSMDDCSFTYRDFNYLIAIKRTAKACSLIAVDEILNALEEHSWQNRNLIEYYTGVKQEIEKL